MFPVRLQTAKDASARAQTVCASAGASRFQAEAAAPGSICVAKAERSHAAREYEGNKS